MDSRDFFQLVQSIIEIRRNSIFLKKFLLGEDYSYKWTTDFLAIGDHYFFVFQKFLPVIEFFGICLAGKYFSIKSFIAASENGLSG